MDVTNLSPAQLRKAADLKERIDSLMAELGSILDGVSVVPFSSAPRRGGRRQMSAEGRARIAAAARARWAKVRGKNGGRPASPAAKAPGKRTMSPAARARIAAAARARWAKAKAAGKTRL